MFETFYEMRNTPFTRNIPTDSLYESPAMREALGRLIYTADRQLFAVVTADSGCGKSTLLRKFIVGMPKGEYLILYLADSKLTPRWFYKGMLDQLGIESRFYRGDAKRQLQKEIETVRSVQKKKVVCILDEAHLLEKETIEEFRFLLNYKYDSMSPMALVLVGQSELWDRLRLQRYAAVRQRIDMNCVLPHLDRAETEAYIRAHLVYAGGIQDIFTDRAVDEIFKTSTGILRIINRICEKSLMYAYQQQKRLIDEHMIRFVTEHEMLGGKCMMSLEEKEREHLVQDYTRIQERLEETLAALRYLSSELSFAIEDIGSDLDYLERRIERSGLRLQHLCSYSHRNNPGTVVSRDESLPFDCPEYEGRVDEPEIHAEHYASYDDPVIY